MRAPVRGAQVLSGVVAAALTSSGVSCVGNTGFAIDSNPIQSRFIYGRQTITVGERQRGVVKSLKRISIGRLGLQLPRRKLFIDGGPFFLPRFWQRRNSFNGRVLFFLLIAAVSRLFRPPAR